MGAEKKKERLEITETLLVTLELTDGLYYTSGYDLVNPTYDDITGWANEKGYGMLFGTISGQGNEDFLTEDYFLWKSTLTAMRKTITIPSNQPTTLPLISSSVIQLNGFNILPKLWQLS